MLAIAAAIVFGIWFLLDLFNTNLGVPQLFNFGTMITLGLLLLALYLAGVGSGPRTGGGSELCPRRSPERATRECPPRGDVPEVLRFIAFRKSRSTPPR